MAASYSAFSSSIPLAAPATPSKPPCLLEEVAGSHFLLLLETGFATLTAQETLPGSFDSGAG